MNQIEILIITFSVTRIAGKFDASPLCLDSYKKDKKVSYSKSKNIREIQAKEFAEILAVDAETQRLVSNPWIAQYIYMNFFAEKTERAELNRAFQDIVDSVESKNTDISDLINNKLSERINDPAIQARVAEVFSESDKGLRPGKLRTSLYKMNTNIKQALALPTTIKRIKDLVNKTFSQDALEKGLFDFYGATQLL